VNLDTKLSLPSQHGFDYLTKRKRFGKSQKTEPVTNSRIRMLSVTERAVYGASISSVPQLSLNPKSWARSH
jgi:hypothetical protein